MQVVLIGDSHTHFVIPGLNAYLEKNPIEFASRVTGRMLGNGAYMARPFFRADDDRVMFTVETYKASFASITGRDWLSRDDPNIYAISMGFHSARVYKSDVWRRYAPWSLASSYDRTPLSTATIEAISEDDNKFIFAFLSVLLDLNVKFFVISAPPPKRTHFAIRKNNIPPEIVLEVDRIYRAVTARFLDRFGIAYVLPPPSAYDGEGFMSREFNSNPNDPHHANAAFGELLAPYLIEEMCRLGAASPKASRQTSEFASSAMRTDVTGGQS